MVQLRVVRHVSDNDTLQHITLAPALAAHAKWLGAFNNIIDKIISFQPLPIPRWHDFFRRELLGTKIPVAERVCRGVNDAYEHLLHSLADVGDKYHANDVTTDVIKKIRAECRVRLRATFISAIDLTRLLFFF